MGHRRHGAVLDPRRHGLQPRRLEQLDDTGRRIRGGDIDVGHPPADQRIAQAAADKAHFAAAGRKGFDHRPGVGRVHPGLVRQTLHGRSIGRLELAGHDLAVLQPRRLITVGGRSAA